MGDRADYVLVRGGDWRLHYSHWGATGLDVQLLDGPGSASRFIAAQREMARDDWLDEVWCEGAALVDHDARELLFFTWHLDGYVHRRALFTVLGRTWPGWRVRWAYDGLADLAAYLRADPALVRSDRARAEPEPEPPETSELPPAEPVGRSGRTGTRSTSGPPPAPSPSTAPPSAPAPPCWPTGWNASGSATRSPTSPG